MRRLAYALMTWVLALIAVPAGSVVSPGEPGYVEGFQGSDNLPDSATNPAGPFSPVTAQPHVAMELVAETTRPQAGGVVTLAFAGVPKPGWHGYWKNPGDAGIETTATWTLPSGWSAGPLRYPVPERLLIAGLMNYVYERPFAMLADVQLPAGARGLVPVRVRL
ncbi:MAG TPA: protein-disulfide reductase DsbD domain-containing protein, partial [Sphingomonas sp.]